ncbi:hypothetical protein D3C73_1039870 [compost metagenome]
MSIDRLIERQNASKRLNQLIKLRDVHGHDDEWIHAEISDLETFLREKEEQPV